MIAIKFYFRFPSCGFSNQFGYLTTTNSGSHTYLEPTLDGKFFEIPCFALQLDMVCCPLRSRTALV